MREADLTGTRFDGATVSDVDLSGAQLHRVVELQGRRPARQRPVARSTRSRSTSPAPRSTSSRRRSSPRRSVSRSAEGGGKCRSRSTARGCGSTSTGRRSCPTAPTMRERPTVVLVHGGPGSYDHSYFKPALRAADGAWHRSSTSTSATTAAPARHDPARWTFEVCADDVRAFCDIVGIVRPIVLGHSMGGFVAMLYGARHPGPRRRADPAVDDGALRPGPPGRRLPARRAATRWPSWPGATTAAIR